MLLQKATAELGIEHFSIHGGTVNAVDILVSSLASQSLAVTDAILEAKSVLSSSLFYNSTR